MRHLQGRALRTHNPADPTLARRSLACGRRPCRRGRWNPSERSRQTNQFTIRVSRRILPRELRSRMRIRRSTGGTRAAGRRNRYATTGKPTDAHGGIGDPTRPRWARIAVVAQDRRKSARTVTARLHPLPDRASRGPASSQASRKTAFTMMYRMVLLAQGERRRRNVIGSNVIEQVQFRNENKVVKPTA